MTERDLCDRCGRGPHAHLLIADRGLPRWTLACDRNPPCMWQPHRIGSPVWPPRLQCLGHAGSTFPPQVAADVAATLGLERVGEQGELIA